MRSVWYRPNFFLLLNNLIKKLSRKYFIKVIFNSSFPCFGVENEFASKRETFEKKPEEPFCYNFLEIEQSVHIDGLGHAHEASFRPLVKPVRLINQSIIQRFALSLSIPFSCENTLRRKAT